MFNYSEIFVKYVCVLFCKVDCKFCKTSSKISFTKIRRIVYSCNKICIFAYWNLLLSIYNQQIDCLERTSLVSFIRKMSTFPLISAYIESKISRIV